MPTPPIAERRQHAVTHHGITRNDPYHWLRADNWQEVMQDPATLPADIRAYIEAENAYFAEMFETPHAELSEKIYREIRGRIKEDDSGIASPDGPWAYNSRMEEGKQYPILVRTPRNGGDEQVLIDCNVEAGDGYRLRRWRPRAFAQAAGLERRPAGLGVLHSPHPRHGDGQGHRRSAGGHRWRRRLVGRQQRALLYRV